MSVMNRDRRKSDSEDAANLKDIWKAIQKIDATLHGNGNLGLKIENDRNTNFRKAISKSLWFIITPLYLGLISIIIKVILEN